MSVFQNQSDRRYAMLGLRIAGDFGATIAVPVVLFVWIGQKLDTRWQTSPKLMILGFVLAAVLSGFSLYRKAKQYGREFQALDSDKGKEKEK